MSNTNGAAAGPSDLSKELAKLVVLILTAVGLCYDVGYFAAVDLSYFSVFSFTEHIVFSLQAIPFAFFFGVAILCLVFAHNAALKTATSTRRHTRLLIAEGVLAICAAPILHVYSPDSL